jgi:SAM-dependent methyltransferase
VDFLSLRGSFEKKRTDGCEPEMASMGLHDEIERHVCRLLPNTFHAIDLGAGSGAWGKRLISKGNSVSGVVLDPALCAIKSFKADLNAPFAEAIAETFDLVTCIEVLEHLENPRNVFREARKLLRPGGVLLISTPNASGIYSRVKFLLLGRFAMFDDEQYAGIGHITPLTHWQLMKMFSEVGITIELISDYDATPRRISTLGDLIKRVIWILRPLMRGHVGTQHIIMAGRSPGQRMQAG